MIKERKIPFELKAEQAFEPNDETLRTMQDIENGKNLEKFTLKELESERKAGKF